MGEAVVVGAGVGGLSAAAALQRRGWRVTVLERATALDDVGAGLALAPNAVRALDAIGVGEAIRQQAVLQGEAGITDPRGRWISRTSAEAATARYGAPAIVVHRATLVRVLGQALWPGTLRLGAAVTHVDAAGGRVTLGDGKRLTVDLVVAADGIGSAVRRQLFPTHPDPVYAGVTSWRMVVPAPPGGVRPAEAWGRGLAFGMVLLGDGRVYCYATAAVPPGGRAADERAELLRLFGTWYAPIPALIAAADTVLRTDIRCLDTPLPRMHHGRVALLGDAAHPMTPHLGQGGCQAIEDAVVLAAHAGRPEGLAAYTRSRLARTTYVTASSRRVGRLTRLSHPATVWLRDTALRCAARLGPDPVLRRMDPVLGWRPPHG